MPGSPPRVVEVTPIAIPESISGPYFDLIGLPADAPNGGAGLFTPKDKNQLPFQYAIHLLLRGVYDDNISLVRTNPISDWFVGIHPMLMLGIGDIAERNKTFVRLDYAPSIFRFLDHTEANSVQHQLRLEAGWTKGALSLALTQDVQLLNEIDLEVVEVGGPAIFDITGQTQVNIYDTRLEARYDVNRETYLTSRFDALLNDYSELIDSESYSGNFFFNRILKSNWTLGAGISGGYVAVEVGPQQPYQQLLGRASYQPSARLNATVVGGVEFREFTDHGRDDHITPVVDLSLKYNISNATQLTLSATRYVSPSAALVAADYVADGVAVTVRQRLFADVIGALRGGYTRAQYFPSTEIPVSGVSRTEDYFYLQPSVEVAVARYWSIGVYYLFRENDSSTHGGGFTNNQFGIRTLVKF